LFIILEKAIEDAAKYALFELNNEVTRNNFVGMIRGFLTTVQARDGLEDFMVVCDKTNNTDEVIARGEFVADIYIKPLYSIQYIILNFIATKSVVQFNQLIK
jgi:phage tail sheath protein FI